MLRRLRRRRRPSKPAPASPPRGESAEGAPGEEKEHIVEPEDALPEVRLEDLAEPLRAAAAGVAWTELMPVQAKAIPYLLAGRDLMVQSRTGSGKTGAFVLPTLARVDTSRNVCQALVLVPTRELARQVAADAESLTAGSGLRTVAVYGGAAYGPQLDAFRQGAHLVVGTPGRVLDHLLRRSLSLDGLDILVFDEADRMLSMGFYPDMRKIKAYLPERRINGYMFSATYPPHVMRLAGEFLHKPDFLSLSRDRVHVAETEHVFYIVPPMDKDRCLVRIIELENPASAIIFCNTKVRVNYVNVVLQRFGYDADALSAELSQKERDKVVARVRKGNLRFLVATDVAARGLDIPELSHVILYDTPEDHESYIHRAGRTGRAGGSSGTAISLVAGMEEIELKSIARRYGIDMVERPVPTDEDVEAIVSQRVTALLEARLRSRDTLKVERMQRFLPLARALCLNEDERPLVALLLDDYYQATLHAPPPQPPAESPPRREREPRSDRPADGEKKRRGGRRGRRRRS